ncbi:hypothetical protein CPC08DRAFT_815314 [Agrocybe pediades]|nr:hypothetical protein CPC08DRAFT_815314 [Agrocybe pediades]
MQISHTVGYSRSVRAKCHAPGLCNGTALPFGTLRYGRATANEFGETVEWRHWGCVTPAILTELAAIPLKSIIGYEKLHEADQNKIRMAISLRRIDPNDVPPSAKPKPKVGFANGSSQPSSSQGKRTATQAGLDPLVQRLNAALSSSSTQARRKEEIEDEPYEEEVRDELYCNMVTSVVGIQYYRGMVGPGEQVLLVREPHNRFDRNAIQVKNISRIQVGHLPRNVAAKLAPLLDRQAVTVEGVINDGNLGSKGYTLSITLKIYGPSDKRDQLEPALVWATPGQRGFPKRPPTATSSAAAAASSIPPVVPSRAPVPPSSSQRQAFSAQNAAQQEALRKQQEAIRKQQESLRKAAELKEMLSSLEKVDDEGRRNSLLDTLCSTDDVMNMPLYENPPGIATGEMTVDLMKHQLQGLRWCVDRENPTLPKKESDKPVQFWQLRKQGNKPYYFNLATNTPQEAPPPLGRGALCADAMGLGKTLTMLALILATKAQADPGFSKTTLIVSPLSVLSNWEKQIKDHCTPGTVSSCVYYGSTRSLSAEELQKYDIVITTYQTITGEHTDGSAGGNSSKKKKTERTLFDVPWKRVILDEGHTIRNPKTKAAKAVYGLNASRRWVLTGTPIINSPRDLGSLLTFLQICRPLDNEDFYKRLLLRPLKNGEAAGAELLRALMSHICIRRTKEMQDSSGKSIIELPPVEMIRVPVALSEEARALYDEVEALSKERLVTAIKDGTSNAVVQSNVLSMLTRMRQIALHPALVPANYLEELRRNISNESNDAPIMPVTPEEKLHLQALLAQAIEDCEECPICMGVLPNDSRITSCRHMFCLACITEVISRDAKCPMDRRTLTMGDLHEPPPPTDLTQKAPRYLSEEPEGFRVGSSAKIEQLIDLLKLSPMSEKSLVFSQFTSFLDKVAEALDEEGIPYVRFDGKMSAKRRQEAIARFSVPIEEETPVVPDTSSKRPRKTSSNMSIELGAPDVDDNDSDFVVDDNDKDDDDDYLVDSDDDKPSKKSKKNKGKGKASDVQRLLPLDDDLNLGSEANPRVMLLSLKAGALGLNLTVANNVFLMDPWWQEGIESQAVDRVNRIGQKKPVHVYQLVSENTVESKVLDIQEKKKQLIQHAFSGIKRTETQRQQREARLQDLVELFGIRNSQLQ